MKDCEKNYFVPIKSYFVCEQRMVPQLGRSIYILGWFHPVLGNNSELLES